jgi:protein-S-isoprenylcysteine O-methyltransferase Ste14
LAKEGNAMHAVDYVITAGWAIFWLFWIAAAVHVKAGRRGLTRFAGFRVAILLIVVLLVRLRLFGVHEGPAGPWLQGIGFALFLLGLALAVWARLYLGRNWGMPMSEKAEPELVRTGPYRFIRHPIYSGILLALVGTALATSLFLLIGVALLGTYFAYSAHIEERNMTRLLPDEYPAYKRSTRMLVPFIF